MGRARAGLVARATAAAAIVFACATPALAQADGPDPFATARFRFGGFAMSPGINVTNLGFDGNVFNEWTDPKSDFTATVAPSTDAWLRFGPLRATLHGSYSYLFFASYPKERAVSTDDSLRLELRLAHFRPYGGVSYLNTRDRPGYEIDARVRRTERGIVGGVELPLTAKTTMGIAFKRGGTDYAEGEGFNGTSLRDAFNRTTYTYTASLRHALTPLTTIVCDAEWVRERFSYATSRDSNGFRVVPGVEFKPLALISGSARVGFRQLNMIDSRMPDYTGPVASVDLGYTLLNATRFSVAVNRDVSYSYEVNEPYYLLTGGTATITQRLSSAWDVQARAGIQLLDYQRANLDGAAGNQPTEGRTDTVRFYGGGIGYRLGTDVRIRFNVDYYTRRSDQSTRQYKGLRTGTAVTYGF